MSDASHAVRQIIGVSIQNATMDEALALIDRTISQRRRLLIGVVNAAKIVNMHRDPELGRAVLSADVIYADGMSVVWASRLLGRSLPERVPGIDLMHRMLAAGQSRGYRVYCLGATQEVLDVVVRKIGEDCPGTIVAGSHHGYFGADEEQRVAEDIRDARADILFVAMTSPKKERFLARWAPVMNVPVCHGVGGAFDVMAGKVKRAPVLWQKCGMEWAYRVVQEPRRMWRRYLVTNTLFLGMLLRQMLGGRLVIPMSDEAPAADPPAPMETATAERGV